MAWRSGCGDTLTCMSAGVTRRVLGLVSLLALTAMAAPSRPEELDFDLVRVPVNDLVQAMQAETGYDITKTTTTGRFQGNVFLRLARECPDDRVLLIDHEDWYQAFMRVSGLTPEQMPGFMQRSYELGQDVFLDARPEAVLDRVGHGAAPQFAVNVLLFWPRSSEVDGFTFEDRMSEPAVLVRQDRVITFRLLDFGDWILFDQLRGSKVRPLTGALATLFRIIGLASIKQVRTAVSSDGVVVARAKAHKAFITVTETVTVMPDGKADRGLPEDRPDLEELEDRLRQDLGLHYARVSWNGLPDS